MKTWKEMFRTSKLKKMMPVLALSCAAAVSFSSSEVHAETVKCHRQETKSDREFAKLEEKYDANLGVFALDTGTNKTVTYHPDERFAYASTHKALAAGALLQQKSIEDLNERIFYTRDDLVNYNPITEKHVDTGMTLRELADASLRYSDNTAGNLILQQLGGPDGFKEALEKIGDDVTLPERFEPDLNEVNPGETHDTSTPRALATSLQTYVLGQALPENKRALLTDWMKRNTTGDALIRAGVPKSWEVADKTGAGSYATRNDIAILWPPKGDPIILAILSNRTEKDAKYNDKLIAEAAKQAVKTLKVTRK
ncbi:class A beta-lactamase [Priestia megaterium]|uniref:class A beta-lactamase n=1 Tax=Priestia megaterium TaxID=1404 RepID=UPI001865D164|nr:class A beta-lactamase [Priestia megaterium]MBE2973966.1 class A beta-lactamase [Priestia megaterium]MBT2255301.1 class A beta-lactamase [Priestia megaterium]MBT2278335.1 class A beta-lactamase [Priestia megaterium]